MQLETQHHLQGFIDRLAQKIEFITVIRIEIYPENNFQCIFVFFFKYDSN
jgi:hypothetical protein